MKRDFDLIRELPLKIEANDEYVGGLTLEFEDASLKSANAHLRLMVEGNLIEAHAVPDSEDFDLTHYLPTRTT